VALVVQDEERETEREALLKAGSIAMY